MPWALPLVLAPRRRHAGWISANATPGTSALMTGGSSTYHGWSHAENDAVPLGRDLLQRGFDLRRANANAAHALAHAVYESGAGDDAEKLISGWLPTYYRTGLLHGHITWHEALVAWSAARQIGRSQFTRSMFSPRFPPRCRSTS
jgi:hypothetical protein